MPIDNILGMLQLGSIPLTYGINELSHGQQLRHQNDFMQQQIAGSKELSKYNQLLALDTWEKTNYPAQMEQLEKAGLNPGLLYAKGGAGGTTNFGGSGSVNSGTAPSTLANMGMGLQLASQLQLMKAQKENIEADTANKKAQIPVHGADVPLKQAETEAKKAGIPKTEQETELLKLQQEEQKSTNIIRAVEARLKTANESNMIGIYLEEYKKLVADRELSEKTKLKVIAETERIAIENALTKSQTNLNEKHIQLMSAQVTQIMQGIEQRWQELFFTGVSTGHNEMKGTIENDLKDKGFDAQTIEQVLPMILLILGLKKGSAPRIKSTGREYPVQEYINY